jgi:Prenyltransferase and squalene oxidase repeat
VKETQTMTSVAALQQLFDQGLLPTREKWSLLSGEKRSLDLVNHVLRVALQLGRLEEFVPEFEALAAAQHKNGGWGDHSTSRRTGVRNTCFATRNLIRANRRLGREDLAGAIERAVRYVLATQDPEGFFPDPVWGPRDATSSSMGLLHYALQESFGDATEELHAEARERLARAAAHLERSQESDGSWHDTKAYEAPVGPTSHLLPKMVLAAQRATPPVQAAVDYLIGSQGEDGSWDRQHVDHTCDATRALLLTYSVLRDERLPRVIEGGVRWLDAHPASDGLWGVRPGRRSNLIMTCDVLDCFSKYEAHQRDLDLRVFWQ